MSLSVQRLVVRIHVSQRAVIQLEDLGVVVRRNDTALAEQVVLINKHVKCFGPTHLMQLAHVPAGTNRVCSRPHTRRGQC